MNPKGRRKHLVHILNGPHVAQALCDTVKGPPRDWPWGHGYVPLADAHEATCPKCIKVAKDRK